MARAEIDRDLLFGLLAIRSGLIDRSAMAEALRDWGMDKSRPLAGVLAGRGALPVDYRAILEAQVVEHLRDHGDDPTQSLEAVDADKSTLDALASAGGPELDATIDALGSDETRPLRPGRDGRDGRGPSDAGAGRFRILRPHDRGGLGAVFVALDTELNREVALKQILDRHADDPASRARFLLEAEITGGLEHPGIVPVYGLGSDDDGRPYYAMRFIRGDSLKDAIAGFHRKPALVEDGRPPVGSRELELRKLLRRFLDVCNAIEYAHDRGIIHRDLKPGNVMVGKHGETLVVDWGLAKPIGRTEAGPAGEEPALTPQHPSGSVETLPGSAIGTPAYMSPEQAAGELGRIGPRSDVYSLGATLYCLLTGRPPYEGPDAGLILRAVRQGDLTPPREVDPSIDRALEAVCLKAMAREPEGRYASAAALAEEVELWMADEPVLAFPEPRARRLGRWGRRHSSLVSGCGVFLVLAALGLGLVAWLVARQNQRLEAARKEATGAGLMAHQSVRIMLSDVAGYDLLNTPQGELLRVKLAERALSLYRDFSKVHPGDPAFNLEYARAEEQVAGLYRMIGRGEQAKVEYDAAIARLRGLLSLDPGSIEVLDFLSHTEGQLAEMLKLAGKRDAEAEPHYREAIRIAEWLLARHPEVPKHARLLAVTSNDLSECLLNAGRVDEARPLLERGVAAALAFRASLPAEPDPKKFSLDWIILPMVQSNLANALTKLGRGREAEAAVRPAVETFRALLEAYPRSNDVKLLLANALMELGDAQATDPARLVEALGNLDEAVSRVSPLLVDFPNIAVYPRYLVTLRADRGAVRLRAGRPGPALEDLAYADAKLAERLLAEKEPAEPLREHGKVKASLAGLADLEGDRAKARGLADEAVVLQEKAMAIDPTRRADRDQLDRHRALREGLSRPKP